MTGRQIASGGGRDAPRGRKKTNADGRCSRLLKPQNLWSATSHLSSTVCVVLPSCSCSHTTALLWSPLNIRPTIIQWMLQEQFSHHPGIISYRWCTVGVSNLLSSESYFYEIIMAKRYSCFETSILNIRNTKRFHIQHLGAELPEEQLDREPGFNTKHWQV